MMSGSTGPIEYIHHQLDRPPRARVILHHGLLGGAGIPSDWKEAAKQAAVEIVTMARPGYGRSTPVKMHAVSEWASTVRELAQQIDWQRFAVAGISAGAPYAYACAAHMQGRVTGVGILSGLPQVTDPDLLATYGPSAQDFFRKFASSTVSQVQETLLPIIARWTAHIQPDDPAMEMVRSTLAFEGIGPAREAWLQVRPWGFELSGLEMPIRLWHHREDEQVPYAAAQAMVPRFPRASLHEIEGSPTHGPNATSLREMFEWLANFA